MSVFNCTEFLEWPLFNSQVLFDQRFALVRMIGRYDFSISSPFFLNSSMYLTPLNSGSTSQVWEAETLQDRDKQAANGNKLNVALKLIRKKELTNLQVRMRI
jgi:hypothetical protein